MGCERFDAAGFGEPAGDPDNAVIAAQRARGGIGIGRLAVIHEANAIDLRHAFLAVSEAGKACDPCFDVFARDAEAERHGGRRGGILRIMHARQGRGAAQIDDRRCGIAQNGALTPDIGVRMAGNAHTARQRLGNGKAFGVVNADDGGVGFPLMRKDLPFGGGIAGHVAVAIEMIGAEIEHTRGIEAQRRDSLQHVR